MFFIDTRCTSLAYYNYIVCNGKAGRPKKTLSEHGVKVTIKLVTSDPQRRFITFSKCGKATRQVCNVWQVETELSVLSYNARDSIEYNLNNSI